MAVGDTVRNAVMGLNYTDDFAAGHDSFFSIFPTLANYSFIIGIAIALIVAFLLCTSASYKAGHWIKRHFLRTSFFIVWIYGFIVYDIGMCTGEGFSLVTNAPMALLYAFKIFLLDSDVSEIHEAFHASWAYSFNFALVHLAAAAVSTLFVIKYFGYNIVSNFRMWQARRFSKDVDESYVFWGFNDASVKLIKSIRTHYEDPKSKGTYRIIMVRLNNGDDDNPETRTGIARIFDFLSIPTSELEKLLELKCLTVGTYSNVSNINVAREGEDVLGRSLSLRSLKRILESKTRNKIHMLFLGENEEENLHAVSLLLKDKALKDFVDVDTTVEVPESKAESDSDSDSEPNSDSESKAVSKSDSDSESKSKSKSESKSKSRSKREVIFYCHARYNSIHRVIEDKYLSGNRRVKVVDSSHISVENLKLDKDLLPVNFVRVEKDATVSSSFNSLVVGFSEVGQDSVRFLYEFGAFVKTGSTDSDVRRSGFHMHVVDKNMADAAGAFVANAPAIDISVPFISGMKRPGALITLDQMDCQSVEFYHSLESWIKTLNYIVIATDDDELNITLAVRVFKMAARYRDDMKNLCILTRVHQDDDGHFREIAEYYNRLSMAQDAVKDYDGKMATQNVIKRDCKAGMPIHLFGLDKKTYTYENIIDESMERQAVDFKEQYTASTKEDYTPPLQCKEKYAWNSEIHDYILCVEKDPMNHPTLSAVMGIRRGQGQDYANCFHQTTKNTLADRALEQAGLKRNRRISPGSSLPEKARRSTIR